MAISEFATENAMQHNYLIFYSNTDAGYLRQTDLKDKYF